MKKSVLIACCVYLISCQLSGQVEFKINPVEVLFQSITPHMEYMVSDYWGLDAGVHLGWDAPILERIVKAQFTSTAYGLSIMSKHYVVPDRGADKFYVGMYAKYRNRNIRIPNLGDTNWKRYSLGFTAGYKWVTPENVVLEFALGGGKVYDDLFGDPDESLRLSTYLFYVFDAYYRLDIGYRF